MLKLTGVCILILSFLIPTQLLAQGKQITGTVTTSENNQAASGVTITVKGGKTSTTTDAQGNFKITVDNKATTLVFTSASFVTYEAAISGRTVIDVVMTPDVKAIDDVVVVGYTTVKRKDLTGSVSSINSKQLDSIAEFISALLFVTCVVQATTKSPQFGPGGRGSRRADSA